MAQLDYVKQVQRNVDNILHGVPEAMLGRALLEPYTSVNSGSRKLMYSKELDQVFSLINGEVPIDSTGYEIRYGDRSSSIVNMPEDAYVIAKIPKYSFAPNHHYYMVFGYAHERKLGVIERVPYKHITEAYGYLNNNGPIDSLKQGDYVPKNTLMKRSVAFDDYGNRKDGINLNTVYMSLDWNYEDSIIISEPAKEKFTSPLIHPVRIKLPDNAIPLNIHGDNNVYKVLPDIGEPIPNCVVSAFRTDVKDESYFTQQKSMLQKISMSDECYTIHADNLRVVDIDVYVNNQDIINNSPYYAQLNAYYQEQLRFANELENTVSRYIMDGYKMDYDLEKLYFYNKRLLRGDKFIDKNVPTNLEIMVTVLEERKLGIGDKLADRNGGKGVVSNIWPVEMMPCLDDGTRADVIINSPTMYGRENGAQCIEVSKSHISRELIHYIEKNEIDSEEAIQMIIKYVKYAAPSQAVELEKYLSKLDKKDSLYYLESVIKSGYIKISNKPISESFDLDSLNELYKAFPDIWMVNIMVPMKDSRGRYRMVKSRRQGIMGVRYTIRLKQFSEEKFSAVSMSSTNLRNENVKSKAATSYRSAHSSTCNRLGYQEAGCLSHMGTEHTVTNLMIHSASPQARRLTEVMQTGDPYDIDIKLTPECSNRNAEFAETYLKAIGVRMSFIRRVKEKAKAALINCVKFLSRPEDAGKKECVRFINEPNYDYWEHYLERIEDAKADKSNLKPAVKFKFKR